jgi:hypothetical protein
VTVGGGVRFMGIGVNMSCGTREREVMAGASLDLYTHTRQSKNANFPLIFQSVFSPGGRFIQLCQDLTFGQKL